MDAGKALVVLLNYNGKHFLEQFLPGVCHRSLPYAVALADNGSTDGSVEFVKEKFPQVQVVENKGNFGYAQGYNMALSKLDAEYFILLNSDAEVTENWLEPMLALMESDKNIAACQPKLVDYNARHLFEYAGASGGFIDRFGYPFCRGRIFNSIEEDTHQYDANTEVFWASGACLMVRTSAFREAGGLDDSYFAHMEEIDLCWRMKNFGHSIFVVPSSVVYHIGGGTLNKLSKRKTYLNFRNNLSTLTKNHPPKNLLPKILLRMVLDGVAAFKFLFEGQPKHFFAVIRAHFVYYSRLPTILKKRRQLQNTPGFKHNFSQVYKGNVVTEYFLKGKRTFSELKKGFFEK